MIELILSVLVPALILTLICLAILFFAHWRWPWLIKRPMIIQPKWHKATSGDVVCQHGTAIDVHCCNCHHGFLFNIEDCECDLK